MSQTALVYLSDLYGFVEFAKASENIILDLLRKETVVIGEIYWARNVENVFNGTWCARECKRVTGLFKIVEDGSVKDKVAEEEEKIIKRVKVEVFERIRSMEEAVINVVGRDTISITKDLTELELLFLWNKKPNKHSFSDNCCTPVASRPTYEKKSKTE